MGRRSYTAEYKAEAVWLVEERGVSIRQAARELGMEVNTLQAWVKVSRARGGARLRMERDILRPAAAYFSRESR